MEHVRVGQDDVRPAADLPAALLLGVAVVDRGAEARHAEVGERARLVLRERLRRVEVERSQLRVRRERAQDGEVERERLPRRRAGRDDDVAAAAGGVPGVGLVRVEPVDAAGGERLADARVDLVRDRREDGLPRRLRAEVRELLALEHLDPRRSLDRHAVSLPGEACVEPSARFRHGVVAHACAVFGVGSRPGRREGRVPGLPARVCFLSSFQAPEASDGRDLRVPRPGHSASRPPRHAVRSAADDRRGPRVPHAGHCKETRPLGRRAVHPPGRPRSGRVEGTSSRRRGLVGEPWVPPCTSR